MIPNTGCPSIWKQTGGSTSSFLKGKKRQDCQVSARGKQMNIGLKMNLKFDGGEIWP